MTVIAGSPHPLSHGARTDLGRRQANQFGAHPVEPRPTIARRPHATRNRHIAVIVVVWPAGEHTSAVGASGTTPPHRPGCSPWSSVAASRRSRPAPGDTVSAGISVIIVRIGDHDDVGGKFVLAGRPTICSGTADPLSLPSTNTVRPPEAAGVSWKPPDGWRSQPCRRRCRGRTTGRCVRPVRKAGNPITLHRLPAGHHGGRRAGRWALQGGPGGER